MTPPTVPAELIVGFDRHPAAIGRHTANDPAGTARPSLRGFSDITTWSPFVWADQPAETAVPETVVAPPLQAAPPAPAGRPMLAPLPVAARTMELPLPVPARPEWQFPPLPEATEPEAESLPEPPAPNPASLLRPEPPPAPPRPPLDAAAVTAALRPSPAIRTRGDLLWPGVPARARPFGDRLPAADDATTEQSWADEPGGDEFALPAPATRPLLRQAALVATLGIALAALIYTGVRFLPGLVGAGRSVTAVFNAPMMVVRSAASGRVLTVAATAGQVVEPTSPLLTIQVTDPSGPDKPVLAGVHGMIRSVETVPGADLAPGVPLVRLQDCDRAFLTVPAAAALGAGQSVQVRLQNLPLLSGTVRESAGIMEPPNALVVGLAPGSVIGACPVGASATITPAAG